MRRVESIDFSRPFLQSILQSSKVGNSLQASLFAAAQRADRHLARRLKQNLDVDLAFRRLSSLRQFANASACTSDIAPTQRRRQVAARLSLCGGGSFALDDGDLIRCAAVSTPLACVVSLRSTFKKTIIDDRVEIYSRSGVFFESQGGGVGC